MPEPRADLPSAPDRDSENPAGEHLRRRFEPKFVDLTPPDHEATNIGYVGGVQMPKTGD